MPLLAFRLSAFYIAIFLVIGCLLPFWPVWLQARGMTPVEIGVLTAVPVLGKMMFSPLFASFADQRGERKRLMVLFILLSIASFASFYSAEGFVALLIVSVFYGIFWAPIMSFGDNITLLSTRHTDIQYGRVRLWGSLSFIAMSFGFGFVLAQTDDTVIYYAIMVALFLTFLTSLALPDVRSQPLGRSGRPVRTLLKQRPMQFFLISVACIHGSHALYYAFATIHWRKLGYSDAWIGFFWAEAVLAEVVFFLFGAALTTRFGAVGLILLAALACMVRWIVMVFDPGLEVLLITQCLHALTFGAMHLGAMTYLKQAVSLDLSATAQSLYGAASFGIGAGVTLLFAGYFYEMLAAHAFFIMTLIALGGTLSSLALKRSEATRVQVS